MCSRTKSQKKLSKLIGNFLPILQRNARTTGCHRRAHECQWTQWVLPYFAAIQSWASGQSYGTAVIPIQAPERQPLHPWAIILHCAELREDLSLLHLSFPVATPSETPWR